MTKPTGKPKGRPRIEIDFKEFEKLCFIQATLEEIAGWFDCTTDTIEARIGDHYAYEDENGDEIRPTFSVVFAGLRGKGKIGVRRQQFQNAMKGSDKMLVHLGKHLLGQTEKSEVIVTERGPSTIRAYEDKDE